VKIGFIGLAEEEWISSLDLDVIDSIEYLNDIEVANRLVNKLKQEENC
jgi:2',3'-cyclic-nucleotide 2'-phosphodiesterase (5'-nucleotidase family)